MYIASQAFHIIRHDLVSRGMASATQQQSEEDTWGLGARAFGARNRTTFHPHSESRVDKHPSRIQYGT